MTLILSLLNALGNIKACCGLNDFNPYFAYPPTLLAYVEDTRENVFANFINFRASQYECRPSSTCRMTQLRILSQRECLEQKTI